MEQIGSKIFFLQSKAKKNSLELTKEFNLNQTKCYDFLLYENHHNNVWV